MGVLSATIFTATLVLGALGCDELDARRKIQKAGKLYQKGQFSEACPLYDEVLDIMDSGEVGDVARYNGGICYQKMFRPGVETPGNLKIAERATSHMAAYLGDHPQDQAIVGMMSQIWMDSGNWQAALDYWGKEHAKKPTDTEVILILAGIYRQSGDWREAIKWHYKEADVVDSAQGKAAAYMNVAKLTANKLFNRGTIFWKDRLEIADIGITALQKAITETPEDPDVSLYMGTLYNLRGEAHQAAWAQLIDRSNGRYFHKQSGILRKKKEGTPPAGEGDKAGAAGEGDKADAAGADDKAAGADDKAAGADDKAAGADDGADGDDDDSDDHPGPGPKMVPEAKPGTGAAKPEAKP